jgi:hypothetical protein
LVVRALAWMTSRLRADGRGIRSLYFPFSFILADQINRAGPRSKGDNETGGGRNAIVCETRGGFHASFGRGDPCTQWEEIAKCRRRYFAHRFRFRVGLRLPSCHSERSEESRIFLRATWLFGVCARPLIFVSFLCVILSEAKNDTKNNEAQNDTKKERAGIPGLF